MNRIFRSKPTTDFTIINNEVFKNDLSARAMGLLCFMLSLPPDWVLHKNWIYQKLPEGREAINSAWQELEDKKFIIRVKSGGAGRGKLPEINYFISDISGKHADFSDAKNTDAKIPTPETRARKTRKLQSTMEESTIEESTIEQNTIPEIPSGIPGPPPSDPPKEKKRKQPSEGKTLTAFQLFTDQYDQFFRNLNGVPPEYNGASGKSTKSLLAYFKKIATDRAQKDGLKEVTESYIDEKAIEGWAYVLKNWGKLDNFLQGKTRLIDISSNISNIITQLKNGHHQNKSGSGNGPTGAGVSTSSLASAIKTGYAGNGPGQP